MKVDPVTIGLIGSVVGTVLGVLGGVYGTWYGIKRTKGPLEKAFVLRSAVTFWIVVPLFVALIFVIPAPYNQYLWLPYGFWLVATIRRYDRKQQEIRELESGD